MYALRRHGRVTLMCQTQGRATALIVAAERGHTECVRLLVEGGAEKDAKNSVRSLDLTRFLYSVLSFFVLFMQAF